MADRRLAFGQDRALVVVERLGRWAARRKVERRVGRLAGRRLGDLGAGYDAVFVRENLDLVRHATVVDHRLADDLKDHPRVTAIEGDLHEATRTIEEGSLDVVVLISVLEHVWDDVGLLRECRRVLAPGGVLYVHVPSWRGKVLLELVAFRFGWSREEMDDHKRYYDPRDLWPSLRSVGFQPHAITCRRHQLGCSTFAVCRV